MPRAKTPSSASAAPAPQTGFAQANASWLSVVRAYHLCDAVLTQRLAGLGLRVGEHEVLINLLRCPGITQQQLAQRCFVAKSGISMLVTRMCTAKLLQRQPDADDARMWRLVLTAKGTALARKAQQLQDEVVVAMAAPCSSSELQTITAAMQRVGATLQDLHSAGVRLRGG